MTRNLSVLILMAVLVVGCAGMFPGAQQELPVPAIKSAEAKQLLNEYKYAEAVAAYQKIIQEYPKSDWAANAIYNIATAFVSVQNPHKDYAQALTHYDDFLYQYPQHERAADAKNWRQALKGVLDARKENERLLKNIEQLKQLDMRQEQKRLGR